MKLIVAVDRGNSIGWADGRLPWKLPADMKRFKEMTTGGTVVMGFNTFASLKRINGLPNRRNIVLTRKNPLEARGLFGDSIEVVSSLDWVHRSVPDAWIIGGASVYTEALTKQYVDELHITLVDADSGADVRLMTDFVAWKLWTIREAAAGRRWLVDKTVPERDGELYTSYLTARRER